MGAAESFNFIPHQDEKSITATLKQFPSLGRYKMTNAEYAAVKNYTNRGYVGINAYLRNQDNKLSQKELRTLFTVSSKIEQLNRLFLLVKPLQTQAIVYRGMEACEFLSHVGVGNKFVLDGFTSTSASISVALSFLNKKENKEVQSTSYLDFQKFWPFTTEQHPCLMTIIIPPGARAFSLKSLSPFAEVEILLPNKSVFQINEIIDRTVNTNPDINGIPRPVSFKEYRVTLVLEPSILPTLSID